MWPGKTRSPERYRLSTHLCRCGGRLLSWLGGEGMFFCPECGKSDELTKLCWCGYSSGDNGYRCVDMNAMYAPTVPEAAKAILRPAFGSCGCDWNDGLKGSRIGIVLRRDFERAMAAGFPIPDDTQGRVTWVVEPHMCRHCQGRVLRSVAGAGMTGGGNPLYSCSRCGKGGASMGCSICWCSHEWYASPGHSAFACIPYSAIATYPELVQALAMNGVTVNLLENGQVKPGDQDRIGVVAYAVWKHLQHLAASGGIAPALSPRTGDQTP